MLISINWIKDFVDLNGIDIDELIHKFSLSTAEVENEIFYKGSDISGIVVAEIKSVEEHPTSKKLHLLKVDIGAGELVDVVCGAPNVRVGMKTAFAKLGAKIGEIEIAPRELAGFTSCGMCCSEKEIGISDDNSGIMDITDDVAVGTDLKEIYEIDDVIFEVDNKSLTNRPDLWGHYGIAREIATLAGRPLKPVDGVDLSAYDNLPKIDIKIEDTLCKRYSGIRFENITRKVSPVNMRIRLFYCGMRAINYLADLTNYLMLEMGQPMHAFDSRKVENIRVKRFEKSFQFKTLDDVTRDIDENTLMICNGDTPVAIAGIMGGLDSEIVDDTTSLTLESANFDAVSIRKSSSRLGHRTDASMRYEKSLDPEMTTVAISRFVKLLSQYDEGVKVTSSLTDEYAVKFDKVTLSFDKKFVDRYTGIEISNDTIVATLTALGFGVTLDGDNFTVEVPSWRATKDVTLKADIIEEITRIYGYDNFDVNTVATPLYPVRMFAEKSVEEQMKDILVKRFSLHEVHSYIWAYADEYKKLGIEVEENIKLCGAANPNIETIRRSLIPNQLCQLKINTSYAPQFGIFEIAHVIDGVDENNLCRERKKLGITLFSKTESLETLYFRMTNMLAVMIDDIKHKAISYNAVASDHGYVHPKNYNEIICDGKVICKIGLLYPTVQKKIDKKGNVVFAELDIDAIVNIENAGIKYAETSKFPSIEVDLTFLSDKYAPIKNAIEEVNSELIKNVSVADIYNDEAGKAITIRISFVHAERTLTKDEVMEIADKIIAILKNQGIALKG
ncbi:MAG: phenylalanine--tRNA ligase subunit beta [Ruminiclostridium sp.]|nr:phenylalanine--tRNA ligase subunit beta [Ruminiclostridium sp.]